MKNQPYPSYKNSNILWLGNIPIHWKIKRIKHTTKVKGRIGWQGLSSNEFIEEGPYLVTGTDFIQGCINWSSCYHVSEERYMKDPNIQLHEGDLLITKDGTIGKTAIVKNMPYKACLNSGIFVTRPITEDYNILYLYWVLNSNIFDSFINYHTKIGTTISHLYQYIFVDFSFPIPSLQEQQNISAFLDREIQKIDSLIRRKKQQIELLQENRIALISNIVTKGLNPNISMKNTGIEWLGEIPKHWKISRLGDYAKVINGYPFDSKLFDRYEGIPLVRIRDIFNNETEVKWTGDIVKDAEINNDDIIIGMDGDFHASWWQGGYAMLNQRVCCIRANEGLNQRFTYYFIPFPIKIINDLTYFTTVKHLSSNDVLKIRFGLPGIDEQDIIADFLDKETMNIDKLIKKIQLSIENLREYRIAIISAAVTGKIDVRMEVA